MSSGLKVAIAGPTGAVGHALLQVMAERKFPVRELVLMASSHSAGSTVTFEGESLTVHEVTAELFQGVDVAFFATGADISSRWIPVAVAAGAVAIDKSSFYRMDPAVPLVVPEVNARDLEEHHGIIASPNCSTIQLVVAVAPLIRRAGARRLVVASYQSVSGTGQKAMSELETQTRDVLAGKTPVAELYPRPIAFNLFPHIDDFDLEGNTGEEIKIVRETRKILGLPTLPITATCVRVPVFISHAEAVWLETEEELGPAEAQAILSRAEGVQLWEGNGYPTPLDAAGKDPVMVGRVRRDPTVPNGLVLWVVADNLRKGAATNAVQIAETLFGVGT